MLSLLTFAKLTFMLFLLSQNLDMYERKFYFLILYQTCFTNARALIARFHFVFDSFIVKRTGYILKYVTCMLNFNICAYCCFILTCVYTVISIL